MSGTDYSYDEQGQFFPFFIGTVAALVTVPLTYSLLKPSSDPGATAPRIRSDYTPEHADLILHQRKKQRRRERKIKRIITVVVGWSIMGLMAYLIMVTARTVPKIWNPYDILGISESATEKQIKSHYKRLSLKFHPDKIRPDPAKNETLETLNDYFVDLTKAYKALTDEEIRNNFIQYGHPDGKQSFSIGIALPKFIVTDGNGKYVLAVYALLLGVLLPYLVGTWWYGTQRMSTEKVLIESANNLFREYDGTGNMDKGEIIKALSCGAEFREILKGEKAEADLGKLEARVLSLLPPKDRQRLEDLDGGARRKALALIWAYLHRVELDDAALNEQKIEVAPIAHALNQAFTSICLAFSNVTPILNAYSVTQSLIQAIPPNSSPLLQLPHFTEQVVQAIEGDSKTHLTVQKFMSLPEPKRQELIAKTSLTKAQYKTATDLARQLPDFQVAKAFFKVVGEKVIIPGSLVSMIVKGRFISPGTPSVPEIDALSLEDIDPDEDDLDAILGRAKKSIKNENGEVVKVEDDKPVQPPLAYAPYYARDYSPRWHVFLTDSKLGKMAVPPFTFTTFDKAILDGEGKPTFEMQTLKAQFQAPPQAGRYTFVMHVVCDSYVGLDTKCEVVLVVEEASKAEVLANEEDEISEPDEDSLAGQMAAMKGGAAPSKKQRKKVEESDEDESGTDEVDDDTSETDTDTDEE